MPAIEPSPFGLVLVVRSMVAVARGSDAMLISHHVVLKSGADTQVLQAMAHESVLAPIPHWQGHALRLTLEIPHECAFRDGLDRAPQLRPVSSPRIHVAILDELGLAICMGPEVPAKSLWEEDCIRVDLNRPIVVQVVSMMPHRVPHVHEELGVGCSVVFRAADWCLMEDQAVDRAVMTVLSNLQPLAAKDRKPIAIEDAKFPVVLPRNGKRFGEDLVLVRMRHHDRNAIQ